MYLSKEKMNAEAWDSLLRENNFDILLDDSYTRGLTNGRFTQ